MDEDYSILAIKPEFERTKIGVYSLHNLVFLKSIPHPQIERDAFQSNTDQYQYRAKSIVEALKSADIDFLSIRAIVARGGLLKPIESGIYEVNEAMKTDLRNSSVGVHSVNLGGLIADELKSYFLNAKAYIADPAVVDEMEDIARITGIPGIKRNSVFHALNHKYVARKYAQSIGKSYDTLNLIVAHLGDGISIGAHKQGRVVDVNQCFDGEGPFSLERAGTLPMIDFARLCYSGKYTLGQIEIMLRNEGGIFAYTGTSSSYSLENAVSCNDIDLLKLFEAMAYQVAKYIGYMFPVFQEPVDAVLITGTLANNKWFVNQISDRVKFIAPLTIYPGEDVLDALAMNGTMVLKGEVAVKTYC